MEGPPGTWTPLDRSRVAEPCWPCAAWPLVCLTILHRVDKVLMVPLPGPLAPQLSSPITCSPPLVPSLGPDPSCALPAPCPMSLEPLVQFVMIRSLSFPLSEVTICTILSLKSSVLLFVSAIRQGCTSGSPTWACEVGMHFTVTNSGDQRYHLKPRGEEVKDGVLTLNPGFTPSRLCDLKQVP